MKRVAVIGAGPSGLAACKAALECGFMPTVFEARGRLGGVWDPQEGFTWESMTTNLSKHTCCFSDFPWEKSTPNFPHRSQVYGYLRNYAESFGLTRFIRFHSRVVQVEQNTHGWVVQWREGGKDTITFSTASDVLANEDVNENEQHGQTHEEHFDCVLVATGIFSSAHTPKLPGLSNFQGKVIHSHTYRRQDEFTGKRVMMVGGSFSGIEVAAEVAETAEETYHHIHRPVWVLPKHIKNIPLDLALYARKNRYALSLLPSAEAARKRALFFESLLGNPGEISPALKMDTTGDSPMYTAVSDTYLQKISSGRIQVLRGKIKGFRQHSVVIEPHPSSQDQSQGKTASTFANGEIDSHKENGNIEPREMGPVTEVGIDAVVLCTGYTLSLPFFSRDILDKLGFEPYDQLQPLLLHKCTFPTPSLANLAFAGLYRGPYFAVMELQARWACMVWAGKIPPPPPENIERGIKEEIEIRERRPRPQFPHGDYVGLADSIAQEIGVLPNFRSIWKGGLSDGDKTEVGGVNGEGEKVVPENLEQLGELNLDAGMARAVWEGPVLPAHYRLVGFGAKTEIAQKMISDALKVVGRDDLAVGDSE